MTSNIQEALRLFDQDGDGNVSLEELEVLLTRHQTIKKNELKALIRFADQDRDGIIDIDEFSELWKLMGRQGYRISDYQADSEYSQDISEEARKALKKFDHDNDGNVTRSELENLLMKYNTIGVKELNALMRFADQDRDGKIDIQEFSQLWQLIKMQGYKIVNVENKDA